MKKRKRLLLGIIISIALTVTAIVLSISSTQALFTHKDTSTRRSNYSTGILSITAISKSDTISLDNTLPMSDENGILQEPYTFTIKNNGNIDYQFDIQLLSTTANTFDPQYIKIKVDNDAVTTLSALTDSKIKTGLTLAAQQTVDISIRVWLDINTPNSQIGKTFTSQLVINGIAVSPTTNYGVSAAAYITNLYNNAAKTVVTNNNIDYNYATSVSLMNDRLGGTTKDLNAGNIRYYGANPNNYIWLGEIYTSEYTVKGNISLLGYENKQECIDEEIPEVMCTEDIVRHANEKKLYRIIGVFDNMLKVIAVDQIGQYSWDTSDSSVNNGYGVNEWSQADLMKLLNPGYENETANNSLYWNRGSGTCYKGRNNFTTSCDFTNTGLSDIEKEKIATIAWNLGGAALDFNNYVNTYYEEERGTTHISNPSDGITRQNTWIGKIGLIYPSDYGYAVNFDSCSNTPLSNYSSLICINNNWLHNSVYWTITAYAKTTQSLVSPSLTTYVGSSNDISIDIDSSSEGNFASVRPVFYLNSEVSIASGTGTNADPYVLR